MSDYYTDLRKKRIQEIQNHIQKEQPIPKKKVKAEAAIEFGVKNSTVEEMIQILIDGDRIVETDEGLQTKNNDQDQNN